MLEIILVQGFRPLKIKITQFPNGFHHNLLSFSNIKRYLFPNLHDSILNWPGLQIYYFSSPVFSTLFFQLTNIKTKQLQICLHFVIITHC